MVEHHTRLSRASSDPWLAEQLAFPGSKQPRSGRYIAHIAVREKKDAIKG